MLGGLDSAWRLIGCVLECVYVCTVQIYWSRVNVSKLLRTVELGRHWEAAAFLYVETAEFDSAVRVMMEHSPAAFNADKFLEIIQKVCVCVCVCVCV